MWNAPPAITKKHLQNRACQIIAEASSDGICGGHLSSKLNESEGDSVQALFADKRQQSGLQRGWLQSLMRGLPGVESVKNGRGRDFMYYVKEGYGQPSGGGYPMLAPPAAMYQGTPAHQMGPEDFKGYWADSLGNTVYVEQNANDGKLSANLKKPNRKNDVVLPMFPTPVGGGWTSWRCGNSVLDLRISSSHQLCWAANDGRMSVWVRDYSRPEHQTKLKAPAKDKDAAPATGDDKESKQEQAPPVLNPELTEE